MRTAKVVYTGADGDAAIWKGYFDSHVFLSIHYVIDRQRRYGLQAFPKMRLQTMPSGTTSGSIGIELVHNGNGHEEFGQAQVDALVVASQGYSSATYPFRQAVL